MSDEQLELWAPSGMVVHTAVDYAVAGARRVAIKAYLQKVHAYWDETVKAAYDHYIDLRDGKRKPFLVPAEEEEAALKQAMDAWLQAEDRRKLAEQAAADAAAKRVAEEERLALAVALAVVAPEAADALLEAPVEVAPTFMGPTVPQVVGVHVKKQLVISYPDPKATVLAVAAGHMLANAGRSMNPAILAFLKVFEPVKDAWWALSLPNCHDRAEIRRQAEKRGTEFKLPGVVAERKRTS